MIIYGRRIIGERKLTTQEYDEWSNKFDKDFELGKRITTTPQPALLFPDKPKELIITKDDFYIGTVAMHVYNVPVALIETIVYYKIGKYEYYPLYKPYGDTKLNPFVKSSPICFFAIGVSVLLGLFLVGIFFLFLSALINR